MEIVVNPARFFDIFHAMELDALQVTILPHLGYITAVGLLS